jgi:hypothetical protein
VQCLRLEGSSGTLYALNDGNIAIGSPDRVGSGNKNMSENSLNSCRTLQQERVTPSFDAVQIISPLSEYVCVRPENAISYNSHVDDPAPK